MTLKGYKTYLVMAGLVAYGIGGWLAGAHDVHKALELILEGFGLGALRGGIGKAINGR